MTVSPMARFDSMRLARFSDALASAMPAAVQLPAVLQQLFGESRNKTKKCLSILPNADAFGCGAAAGGGETLPILELSLKPFCAIPLRLRLLLGQNDAHNAFLCPLSPGLQGTLLLPYVSTPFVAKTLRLPCVSAPFATKALPSPRVFAAFVAKTLPLPCVFHSLRGRGRRAVSHPTEH